MIFRAVLVGCGSMSKGWLEAITSSDLLKGRIRIVGLVDLDPATAAARAAEFGLHDAVIGHDLGEILSQTQPDLMFDVVIPDARRAVVETGLRHNCHVLSEKPMASSLADAQALVALAAETGRTHAIVQNRRFISGVRRIRSMLDSGVLGDLTALHGDFFIGAHFGGFRDQMHSPLLLDMAIHTLDAARFMGNKVPQSVYCLETNPRGSWYAQGAAANAIFEMSDGVVFNYRGSWCAEGAPTSWEGAWRIIGTRGSLIWDGADSFEARVTANDGGFLRELRPVPVPTAPDPDQTHGHASVLAEFISAIATGRTPETDGSDNIKSLAMVFAAIESANTQRRVKICA
ncbi:Gfo/Idh/MocA family oxidoreductase [Devosia algicola]|uniref:Gfo/Idh/MocA family oxidoreductase n=1 Tax=Devosia algicola TaxID=3026418 RepID=A0ABY7YMF7_9HYPH|nr:Gfo/Idh/MocA family oxidoreductase [Devosia algicola]WDR02392.1 Gfo/Idh/MocA family oxidoreductase [Devosia algicola]